jgi:hypothetical protein
MRFCHSYYLATCAFFSLISYGGNNCKVVSTLHVTHGITTTDTTSTTTVPTSAKMSYGPAQDRFIKSIRSAIDHDHHYFDDKDWRNLTIKGGRHVGLANKKLITSDFYVKPVAAWVPHLLIPNHLPSCPNCQHSKSIDVSKAKWITNPKILYGLNGHRYLDTKMYYCNGCTGSFTGYNLKSMQIDAKKLTGFFTFNVSNHFAVDDELYNGIVNSGDESSASIERRIAQNYKDKYFADVLYWLNAVIAQMVRMGQYHCQIFWNRE